MDGIKKLLLWMVLGIVVIVVLWGGISDAINVQTFLSEDPYFTYETSLTGIREHSEKADVYKTDMTVLEAASYLAENTNPEEYSDLNNEEYVSFMYEDQYVFIYAGEENKTYVQASARQYAYHGSSRLYRSRNYGAWNFFRDYYFIKGLTRDTHRYGGRSYYEYENYQLSTARNTKTTIPSETNTINTKKPTTKKSSTNQTTKSTNDSGVSARRSSVGTRSSIGGGTSFGK